MRGDRPPPSGLGRGGGRLRTAAPGGDGGRIRARPAVPGEHRPLQAAEGIPLAGRPAEEQLRQDPEDRAAPDAARGVTTASPGRVPPLSRSFTSHLYFLCSESPGSGEL